MTLLNTSRRYPATRLRRLRASQEVRDLACEYQVSTNDLIMPYFVLDGHNHSEPITSMPDIERLSVDLIIKDLDILIPLGLKAIALFPVITNNLKDPKGTEALNPDNLICRTIKTIKQAYPKMVIVADVALDPYTSHGHDGIIDAYGNMVNDATIEILVQQTLNQVNAGADIVAPSDMCDGRIGVIRAALEQHGHCHTLIMSYGAKYASALYAPFRQAVGSAAVLSGDKKNYQMDFRNASDSLEEIALDIQEGADIIIIKPAMFYLDIIKTAVDNTNVPICAYQVSGEYAMIYNLAGGDQAILMNLIIESLTAFKRAGCRMILSYFSKKLILNKKYI